MKNLVTTILIFVSFNNIKSQTTESIFDQEPLTDTVKVEKKYPNVNFMPSIDIGVAGYSKEVVFTTIQTYTPQEISSSISTASTDIDFSQSRNFAINANVILNLTKNVGIVTGLGLSYNSYAFKENVVVNSTYGSYSMDSVTSYSKYKFKNNYLQMPVLLKVQTSNEDFQFAVGPIIGYKIMSKTKAVYSQAGKQYKVFEEGDFNVNPIKLSIGARFNYKGLGVYFNYGLSNLLQGASYENSQVSGYNLIPFEAGVTIGVF